MLLAAAGKRVTIHGRRGMSQIALPTSSTLNDRMQGLMRQYGKSWLAAGGVFGCAAAVHPAAAVCVGSMAATLHVADLAVNKDMDDLKTLPRWLYNRFRGPAESRKRVVVLGSGWGALSFVRKLDPMEFDITIVAPRNYFFYTPMLAGVTTGTVQAQSVLEPVRQTAPMPDATLLTAECTGVDAEAKFLLCQDSETALKIPYDHLVVAVGAQPNTFGIPGVEEHAMFLKELDHGLAVRQRILAQMERANVAYLAGRNDDVRKLLSIAVVGGGPTGVEFAAEVADFINTDVKTSFPNIADELQVTLIEALPQLLPMFKPSVGNNVKTHLSSLGVNVRTETMVKKVDDRVLSLANKSGEEEQVDYGLLVWVAGIGVRPVTKTLAKAFGQSNPRGIEVDGKLRVKGVNATGVFAFGDCAVSGNPLTAQVAAQQGKYLGRVFRDEGADASAPFTYNHQGTMAYVGNAKGVAELATPALGMNRVKDFSFWRNLASCPQSWLKPEHQDIPTPAEESSPPKWKITVSGIPGFAIWRGVYFTKLFSYSNRFNVATDWIRNFLFGRVVAASAPLR